MKLIVRLRILSTRLRLLVTRNLDLIAAGEVMAAAAAYHANPGLTVLLLLVAAGTLYVDGDEKDHHLAP